MRSHGLFSEDFDRDQDPAKEPPALATVPEPAVDPEMRKAELAHVWEEGRQAGLAAARAAQRAQAVAALTRLNDAIQDMNATWLAEARATAEGLARLLCTAMATAFPALCAHHGATELRAVVAAIMPELIDEVDVRLRVAPDHADAVSDWLTSANTTVRVVPDPGMGEADIHLEWRKGEALRDARALWARITAILAPIMDDTSHREKDTGHVD